jgi:hypothetical protein
MRRNFWTKSTKAFVKFDTIEFDENFKQVRQTRSGRDFLDVNMVSASVIIGGKYRGAHFRQPKFHHALRMAARTYSRRRSCRRLGAADGQP